MLNSIRKISTKYQIFFHDLKRPSQINVIKMICKWELNNLFSTNCKVTSSLLHVNEQQSQRLHQQTNLLDNNNKTCCTCSTKLYKLTNRETTKTMLDTTSTVTLNIRSNKLHPTKLIINYPLLGESVFCLPCRRISFICCN